MANTAVDINFYAPEFHVIINGRRLSGDVSGSIQSISVDQELNTFNNFTFEVQDECLEGGFRWLASDLFKYGNDISIHLGYAQRLYPMVEGKIQKIDASFSQGMAPTFTVEGSDRAYHFLTNRGESHVFNDQTDNEIVRAIASKAGLSAVVERTAVRFAEKVKQGGMSYFEFMQDLARENSYELTLSGRDLYFGPGLGNRHPVVPLAWGRELISFNPVINTARLVSEVRVRAWDRSRREAIEECARAGDEGNQGGGDRCASEIVHETFGDVVEVITDQPVQDSEDARQAASARLREVNSDFIEGSGDTIGIPEMKPGFRLLLSGLGPWFSGLYTVKRVSHRIDAGGYNTHFSANRPSL
jgi:phage protein D